VHYCGFPSATLDNTLDCTCGQLQGITVADNFVPWGETLCLAPPDTTAWTESMETCAQVRTLEDLHPWEAFCVLQRTDDYGFGFWRMDAAQDCTESGCNNFDCGHHNLTVGYIESSRWDLDVPVFDTTNPDGAWKWVPHTLGAVSDPRSASRPARLCRRHVASEALRNAGVGGRRLCCG
jgi:hypothetical protein